MKLTVAEGVTADSFASGTYYIFDSTTGFYQAATAYADGTTYYTLPVILGDEITTPIALKGIEAGESYAVWAVVKAYATAEDTEGVDVGTLGDALSWTVSDESIATINTETGVITFTGTNYGTFTVTAAYEGADLKVVTDTITISATESLYTVPGDGTNDFPEYPNEGAVRFDKTATAVGNFSETGIAKVELSMTGVPYGSNTKTDVVIMVDMTASMSDDDVTAAEGAVKELIKSVVYNPDNGEYDDNIQLFVDVFYSASSDSSFSTEEYLNNVTISNAAELTAAQNKIDFTQSSNGGGTRYNLAMKDVYETLNREGHAEKQFVVFVSDGVPTAYSPLVDGALGTTITGSNSETASLADGWFDLDTGAVTSSFKTEYYSYMIKTAGIPVYTVGCNLTALTEPAEVLAHMSSNYSPDGKTSTGETKYSFFCTTSGGLTDEVLAIFKGIGMSIKEAATDVVVEDKIGEDYTVNFSFPNNGVTAEDTGMNEWYIQVLEYPLDSNKERTGTPTVLENFTFDANGALVSHTVNGTVTCEETACTHVTSTAGKVTKIEGTYFTYTCAPLLDANGEEVKNEVGDTITEEYLTWKADKLTTTELVLEYFAYLDNSAGYEADDQVPAGTYYTNEYATLTYTNFNGNQVQQEFPIPQMTWNGAQVTYVFYLVNEAGQPVNRAGRVVPFAESVYVTDPVTFNVTWNEQTGSENILAHDIFATAGVPEVYKLYDDAAQYVIRVYQTENVDTNGTNGNYFQINGSADKLIDSALDSDETADNATTVVFNTKTGKKYDKYGYYSIYDIGTTLTNGTTDIETTVKADDIDYANTTVAFAVVWKPELVEDAVVVDYGLDVVIDVIKNDNMAAGVVGVRTDKPDAEINSGNYTAAKAQTVDVYIDSNNDSGENKIGTATVENLNQVRFSLDKDNGMQFTDPAEFYYEADVNYYSGSELKTTSMYSSVTVIPATTVYYEDAFVALTTETKTNDTWTADETSGWTSEGTQMNATQAQDRPGASKISAALDADNNYGYDAAYSTMSQYSLGSSAKVNVSSGHRARATFEFYGTGFDVISLTSNTTGTITVKAYAWDDDTDAYSTDPTQSYVVDTYYGMKEDGTLSTNNPDTLYQVPVMKISGLPYGKYKAEIVAAYGSLFDHNESGNYDFYLDAIRIYDPTGVASGETENETVQNAYLADGEAWPIYEELRNNVISANTFVANPENFYIYIQQDIDAFEDNITYYTLGEDGQSYNEVTGAYVEGTTYYIRSSSVNGIVFIDCNDANTSIADYVSYGPNNELYLAENQAIAFNVTVPDNVADIQLGIKVGNGNSVTYEINGDSYTVNTATDMYYSILDYAKAGTIVIKNVSGGILSLTNIKVTHTSNPYAVSTANFLWMDGDSVGFALKSLRPAAEEEVPETSEPEVVEPETTEPDESETETTVPDETEPEETIPETTEPDKSEQEKVEEAVKEAVTAVVNTVVNALKNLFSRWFR